MHVQKPHVFKKATYSHLAFFFQKVLFSLQQPLLQKNFTLLIFFQDPKVSASAHPQCWERFFKSVIKAYSSSVGRG